MESGPYGHQKKLQSVVKDITMDIRLYSLWGMGFSPSVVVVHTSEM
jgi:hypothetical protein